METPLNNTRDWLDMRSHGSIEVKNLAEAILKIRDKINYLNTNNPNQCIEDLFDAHTLLSNIIAEFISLFQYSQGLLKKDEKDDEISKAIITDLTNMNIQIENQTTSLLIRPLDKFYIGYFFKIKHLLSEPINTLVGPALINSWKIKKEYGDNFYEILNKETKQLAGLHPQQFLISKKLLPSKAFGFPQSFISGQSKSNLNKNENTGRKDMPFDNFDFYEDSDLDSDETT